MSVNTVKAKIPATKNANKEAKDAKAVEQELLPVSWVGIDKINMPPDQADNGTGWLGTLIDNSNLRFTGAYLTGAATPISDYTGSSRSSKRHWMANIISLRSQGWGIAFWYVGYSVGGGESAPAGLAAIATARGKLHAIHAKTIIQATNPNLAGSVVFLDNEDNEGVTVVELDEIRAYYEAFFNELETETPGPPLLPAMRCGLYAHAKIATSFVKDRFDLLVWDVRRDTGNDAEPAQPFADNVNPLFVDPAWKSANPTPRGKGEREMHSFEVQSSEANPTDKWTAWPVGRQFRRYTGATPTVAWQAASGVQALRPVQEEFDYNSSLVRDPSYPVAEPRIAAAPDDIVVAGTFVARTTGGISPPTMKIQGLESSGRVTVAPAANCIVEPDAPIAIAAYSGADTHCVTVRPTGELAAFTRNSAGTWLPIDPITFVSAPSLRRLRAVALVSYTANDLRVFYAGEDHQLYTSRSQASGTWDDPTVAGSLLALHPFSSLATTIRAQQSVDVFALDGQGRLNACSWSEGQGTWQHVALDTAASLLKAGALAATSPDPQKLFVFGIRTDLRLGYWEWTGPNGGWSAPIAVGGSTARLSPHSRLAAHSYTGVVEVAALSHDGTLRLYSLTFNGEAPWTAQTAIPFDNPDVEAPDDYVVPPPSAPTEEAYGWSINPYGDLAIVRETNGTVVYAAGVAPGKSGLLSLNLTIGGSTWQLLR